MTTRPGMRGVAVAACVAGMLGAVPAPLAAQGPGATAPDRVARMATTTRWQFEQCMGGLTYGAPLKWALSYGMGFVTESETRDWCVLGAAKVGFGGASMNVGIANALGHWGSGTAVTAGVDTPWNGELAHAWSITDGDPPGDYELRLWVDGRLHEIYRFHVQ